MGNINREEMYSTFNMGIGMVLIVSKDEVDQISKQLKGQEEDFVLLGEIKKVRRRFYYVISKHRDFNIWWWNQSSIYNRQYKEWKYKGRNKNSYIQ